MSPRWNSPPNWPEPPQGWTPPQGWRPDPAWGPAPEGWQFWVDDGIVGGGPASEPLAQPAGRPNKDAWLKVGIVALVVVGLIVAINLSRTDDVGFVLGRAIGQAALPYLVVAGIGSSRRNPWGWGRYIGYFLLAWLVAGLVYVAGQ